MIKKRTSTRRYFTNEEYGVVLSMLENGENQYAICREMRITTDYFYTRFNNSDLRAKYGEVIKEAIANRSVITTRPGVRRARQYLKNYRDENYKKPVKEAIPKEHTTLTQAFNILGMRAMVRDGSFYLDGKACNLTDIMRAANRIQKAMGSPQIDKNPAWVV